MARLLRQLHRLFEDAHGRHRAATFSQETTEPHEHRRGVRSCVPSGQRPSKLSKRALRCGVAAPRDEPLGVRESRPIGADVQSRLPVSDHAIICCKQGDHLVPPRKPPRARRASAVSSYKIH